jgi:hypothetical protein
MKFSQGPQFLRVPAQPTKTNRVVGASEFRGGIS